MRFRLAAAALAAVTLATPAAAQPNALDVMRGAMQRLSANSEGLQNYTLTLRSGELQTEVYVYRDGDEWEVAAPDDEEFGGMLRSMVVWPSFGELDAEFPAEGEVSNEDLAELADVFTVSNESLDGRPAHVLFVRMDELRDDAGDGEMPDSLRMWVDPDTRQIMRVHVAASAAEMGDFPAGGDGGVDVTMDFGDYRETDGLTIPHRLRMMLEMEIELPEEQRVGMQAGVAAARAQLSQDDSAEARQALAMIDIFMGLMTEGRVDLPVTVENVRVNTGPPSWFEG